jgi:hypothetical protein
MVDRADVDAMANILGKLDGASSESPAQPGKKKQHSDPTSMSAQTDAMKDVLLKLQQNTSSAAENIVSESKRKPDLGFAVEATRTETGVSVSRYDIVNEKKMVSEGLRKNFYHIVDNRTGKHVYEDMGLFETAMGVVKHELYSQDQNKIQRILELDAEYTGLVTEIYAYKNKLKRLDESSIQYDVAAAKYSRAREKLSGVKIKILKAL